MDAAVERYVPMADMLAETFGEDCEVVLHDLADPQHSVVYIAGSHVTGREIGESFDVLVKEIMRSPKLEEGYVSNYFFTSRNGKLVRSSTILIRDERGEIRGALCINIDTTRIMEEIRYLSSFLPQKVDTVRQNESGNDHMQDLVSGLIDGIMGREDPALLNREKRLEKIRFMDSRGIFLVKGAIDEVAEKMGINKVTVYSYLDEVRKKGG